MVFFDWFVFVSDMNYRNKRIGRGIIEGGWGSLGKFKGL